MKGSIYFSEKFFLLYKDTMREVSKDIVEYNKWPKNWDHQRNGEDSFHRPVAFQKIAEEIFDAPRNDLTFLDGIPDQYAAFKGLCRAMSEWRSMRNKGKVRGISTPAFKLQLSHAFPNSEISDREDPQGIGTRQKLPDFFTQWLLGVSLQEFEEQGTVKGFEFKETILPVSETSPQEPAPKKVSQQKKPNSPSPPPPRRDWKRPAGFLLGGIALVLLLVFALRPPNGNTTIIHGDNNGTVMQESPVNEQSKDSDSSVQKETKPQLVPADTVPARKSNVMQTALVESEERHSTESANPPRSLAKKRIQPSTEEPSPPSPNTSQEIVPKEPASISFRVTNQKGIPIANASVFLGSLSSSKTNPMGAATLQFPETMVNQSVLVKVVSEDGQSRSENFTLANNHSYEIRLD